MSVSVMILTYNEESNLPTVLDSVAWCDDVVVFDSFSTDNTVRLAEERGVRVIQRKFDNWSNHQNWAVNNIDFKHPWVAYLDADETADDVLVDELKRIEQIAQGESAFQVRRKDMFMGRWLKRAQLYPTWITRVFQPSKIRYERLVNPVAIVNGPTGRLEGHLIHYPFSHGIAHWYARHNKYSDDEAKMLVEEVDAKNDYAGLFSSDAARRRRAWKRLAYGMPARPLLMLGYLLVARGAFLDGMPGIHYAHMRATYEYMIDLKVKELRRRQAGLPI